MSNNIKYVQPDKDLSLIIINISERAVFLGESPLYSSRKKYIDAIKQSFLNAGWIQPGGATPGEITTLASASQKRKQHESSLPITASKEEINKRRAES